MKIDKKLNLVLEIEQETGLTKEVVGADGKPATVPVVKTLYAHSMPIMEETYERYALLLGEVISTVYSKGFGAGMAGRLALLLVKKLAAAEGADSLADVERGLLAEVEQRTNVIALDPDGGWKPMPLVIAAKNDLITEREYKEVMSNAVFFTAVSWLMAPKEQKAYVFPMMRIFNAQTISSNATEFANSLKMSITPASIGVNQPDTVSSVPV
jgi:hypothetical protein